MRAVASANSTRFSLDRLGAMHANTGREKAECGITEGSSA
jgi:hypothetical protein